MIEIIICDDQDIVREGLKTIIGTDNDIRVIATCTDGVNLMKFLENRQPDLILMDLKMPRKNGVQATREVRNLYPRVKVLILTTYDDDEWVFDSIRAGASGYLLKDTPKNELVSAVKGTVAGNSYVDPSIAGKLIRTVADNAMTLGMYRPSLPEGVVFNDREAEILKYLAGGFSNTEIAGKIFLSEGTVRNYTSAIFTKLGVTDRTQAAVAALRYGLVRLEDL